MENDEDYDVVVDVLQKHYDALWKMCEHKEEWGIMDHIRLDQMQRLKTAMQVWQKHLEDELKE
jgi:hypothetical protein